MAKRSRKRPLTYEDIRTGGMTGFYVADRYKKELTNFLSDKLDPKYYTCESNTFTQQTREKLSQVMKVIKLQNNKVAVICMILYDEIEYLKEHNNDIDDFPVNKQIDACFAMMRVMTNIRDSIKKEFNHKYSIWKQIENKNIDAESTLGKAISYTIKKTMERFTGQNNPIQVLIKEQMQFTAYSAYGLKLMAQKKDIWQDAAERINLPLSIKAIDQRMLHSIEEKEHDEEKRFHDIIEYVYDKKKFEYITRRTTHYIKSEKKIEEEKRIKQEKKQEKCRQVIDKHLHAAIQKHNNWYNNKGPYGETIKEPPYGYKDLLENVSDIDTVYLLLGVIKRKGAYREGYVENNLEEVNWKMTNIWFGATKEEAQKAKEDALSRNNILSATVICLEDHHRSVTITGDEKELSIDQKAFIEMHQNDPTRFQQRDHIIITTYMDHIIDMYSDGYSINDIRQTIPEIYDDNYQIVPVGKQYLHNVIKKYLAKHHLNRAELIAIKYESDMMKILQKGGWSKQINAYLDRCRNYQGYFNRGTDIIYELAKRHEPKEMGPVITNAYRMAKEEMAKKEKQDTYTLLKNIQYSLSQKPYNEAEWRIAKWIYNKIRSAETDKQKYLSQI